MTNELNINDKIRQLLKGQPGVRHEKRECNRTGSWYHRSTARRGGHWKEQYTCPECGRQCKVLANYLGQSKMMMCDGIRFTKEPKEVK